MSIPVELEDLAGALGSVRFAYLVSASSSGAPHAVAVHPVLAGPDVVIDGVGRRSVANITERREIALVGPPADDGGYSLIIDGVATLDGDDGAGTTRIRLRPSRAVWHRPAPSPTGGSGAHAGAPEGDHGCGADCRPIELVGPIGRRDTGPAGRIR